MRLLALDTATENCSAALLVGDRLIEREAEIERGHAERILGMIDEVLAEGSQPLAGLDAIAFGRGPGAFTGVRLAAAVTQGLAFGAGLSVLPVSDLRAVAQRVLDSEPGAATVLVCNDARMKEVYWGCFARGREGIAQPIGDEHVGPPDSVELPRQGQGIAHGAGRGFRAYPDLAARLGARLGAIHSILLPRAREIVRIARDEHRAGRAVPAGEALPVYLRDDVAQPSRH
jgi:tRNA threonylcarbamoyladenosine biosynthesis protein TsaB